VNTKTQYAMPGGRKTFKQRSAEKLIAIGKALLGRDSLSPYWQKPTAGQVAVMSAIRDIEPVEYAGCWDGIIFTLGGTSGQFNMLKTDAEMMIACGHITADGKLTAQAQAYLSDVDGFVTPIAAVI